MIAEDDDGRPKLYGSTNAREWTYVPAAFERWVSGLASNGRDIFVLEGREMHENRVHVYRGGGRWGPAITLSSPFDYHVWKSGTWAITAAPNAVIVAHVDDNSTVMGRLTTVPGLKRLVGSCVRNSLVARARARLECTADGAAHRIGGRHGPARHRIRVRLHGDAYGPAVRDALMCTAGVMTLALGFAILDLLRNRAAQPRLS